jgi:hypothetical protein
MGKGGEASMYSPAAPAFYAAPLTELRRTLMSYAEPYRHTYTVQGKEYMVLLQTVYIFEDSFSLGLQCLIFSQ